VNHYRNHGRLGSEDPTPFVVRVQIDDKVKLFNGSVSFVGNPTAFVAAIPVSELTAEEKERAEKLRKRLTRPIGAIALQAGKGQAQAKLTMGDPADRVQRRSRCKVFKLNMVAGRTYQTDMIKQPSAGGMHIDPFLRLEDSDGNQLMMDDDCSGPHFSDHGVR